MRYRVIKDYESPYPHPLTFHKGEVVNLGEEFSDDLDWKDWIWCEDANGVKAWAPKQYLEISEAQGTFIRDYNAMELSLSVGDVLEVDEIVNGFGMAEKADGDRGWAPMKNLMLEE